MDGIERRERPNCEPPGDAPAPEGRALRLVFEALERAAVRYCVTHGYEDYPRRVGPSDVDIMVAAEWRPSDLAALVSGAVRGAGGELAGVWDGYMVVAGKFAGCGSWFLALDFRSDYSLDGRRFYRGEEILEDRRRYREFWTPAPQFEFACRLLRRIAKRNLDAAQASRLAAFYRRDPAGCRRQLARFWRPREAALIEFAAAAENWEPVGRNLARLRKEAYMRVLVHSPLPAVAGALHRLRRRIRLAASPEGGFSIVLLGPDGAGKSSVAEALATRLRPAFSQARRASFPPGLLRRLRPACRSEAGWAPHELAPRSPALSVLRAVCYWSVYHLVFFRVAARLRAARSVLTVHDRHLVDTLVDPRRYRYSGPMRLLHAIWHLGPQPDLVVLLDAPPEVLQARKQEVPFAETARQCEAYRSLVAAIPNGHVAAGDRPLDEVVAAIADLVLQKLSARVSARLARSQRGPRHTGAALGVPPAPGSPVSAAEP